MATVDAFANAVANTTPPLSSNSPDALQYQGEAGESCGRIQDWFGAVSLLNKNELTERLTVNTFELVSLIRHRVKIGEIVPKLYLGVMGGAK